MRIGVQILTLLAMTLLTLVFFQNLDIKILIVSIAFSWSWNLNHSMCGCINDEVVLRQE